MVAYIKIKYKIWAKQPVFHYYNILYWIHDDFIIRSDKTKLNKYCNLMDIKTETLENIGEKTIQDLVVFIQSHYLKNNNIHYNLKYKSFISNLKGCNNSVFISIYKKPKILFSIKDKNIINTSEIIGSIVSKPCNIYFKKYIFISYYVDYLCVHTNRRKQSIAPELILTHEYIRSTNTKNYKVALFKREGRLLNIVPLVAYNVYLYNLKNIFDTFNKYYTNSESKYTNNSCVKIYKNNVHLILDFIKEFRPNYSCTILPDLGNILNMINTNILIIYAYVYDGEINSIYIYKNSDTLYHNKASMDLIASLYKNNKKNFIMGFKDSLIKIYKEFKIYYLLVENISANNILFGELDARKIKYEFNTMCAYYLYNYAKRTKNNYECFIML